MKSKIGFDSCTKKKKDYACEAVELYSESDLFTLASGFSMKNYDSWFILSAKHHLIEPSYKLAPYDLTLVKGPVAKKKTWSTIVAEQITKAFTYSDVELYFHAGEDYTKLLIPQLQKAGYQCFKPLKGLGIGQQLKWYKERT